MNNPLKLHLGSGSVTLDGWVNIDLEAPGADMLLDLRKPLPFTDSSVSHVYSEHVIEHIEYEEAQALLREIRRVLRPDGVLRLSTPDLAWIVLNYVGGLTEGWGALWQPGTPARLLNQALRYWGHCFVYDRPEMLRILTDAGFGDVRFVEWGASEDPVLDGIESRPWNRELLVEARIPDRPHAENSVESFRAGYAGQLEQLLAQQGAMVEGLKLRLTSTEAALTSQRDEVVARLDEAVARLGQVVTESEARAQQLLLVEAEHRAMQTEVEQLRREVQSAQEALVAERMHSQELASLRDYQTEIIRLRDLLEAHMGEAQRLTRHLVDMEANTREWVRRTEDLQAALADRDRALREQQHYLDQLTQSRAGRVLLRMAGPSRND